MRARSLVGLVSVSATGSARANITPGQNGEIAEGLEIRFVGGVVALRMGNTGSAEARFRRAARLDPVHEKLCTTWRCRKDCVRPPANSRSH
jgi:hypothetical protein